MADWLERCSSVRRRGRARPSSSAASDSLPPLVDAAWAAGAPRRGDLVLGDVRGPNAHQRGHMPGSIPLVLGSPPPLDDARDGAGVRGRGRPAARAATASPARSGSSSTTRGDCVGAAASAAGRAAGRPSAASPCCRRHRRLAGRARAGAVELEKTKTALEPRLEPADAGRSCATGLTTTALTILDVRTRRRVPRPRRLPVRPAPGPHPGRRHLEVERLFAGPGSRTSLGDPRARRAARGRGDRRLLPLRLTFGPGRAGAQVRRLRRANYPGSWHEWSRHEDLPAER